MSQHEIERVIGRAATDTAFRTALIDNAREAAGCIVAAILAQPCAAQTVRAETVASGLDHPWALAFLGNGRFLLTERPGHMRIASAQGQVGPPLACLP